MLFILYVVVGIWGLAQLYENRDSVDFVVSAAAFDVISVIVWLRILPFLCMGYCCTCFFVVFLIALATGNYQKFKDGDFSVNIMPGINYSKSSAGLIE